MPVGAIIGGVASIGGALLSSKSNSKAIDKASDAQAAATKEATQLQRDVYNQNVGFQTPYLNTGNAAMAQINALLGLNVPQSAAAPQTLPANETQVPAGGQAGIFDNALLRAWQNRIASGQATIDDAPAIIRSRLGGAASQTPTPAQVPTVSQPTAQQAYDQFKQYTGYTNRLNEGLNAVNSGYAANGTLQSGAALQALNQKAQDYASGEFMNYMGLLGQQQQLGPGAANALSGVGTNYANAAGNLAMQNGNNIANAAIASANNRNQLYSGIASGIGGMAGSIFGGSSYSDRRLKTKIRLLRREPDGLGWYEFAYHSAPDMLVEGVMADEVKALRPKAYSEDARGYGMVNYAELA